MIALGRRRIVSPRVTISHRRAAAEWQRAIGPSTFMLMVGCADTTIVCEM
jgi:hypothetical protein